MQPYDSMQRRVHPDSYDLPLSLDPGAEAENPQSDLRQPFAEANWLQSFFFVKKANRPVTNPPDVASSALPPWS